MQHVTVETRYVLCILACLCLCVFILQLIKAQCLFYTYVTVNFHGHHAKTFLPYQINLRTLIITFTLVQNKINVKVFSRLLKAKEFLNSCLQCFNFLKIPFNSQNTFQLQSVGLKIVFKRGIGTSLGCNAQT